MSVLALAMVVLAFGPRGYDGPTDVAGPTVDLPEPAAVEDPAPTIAIEPADDPPPVLPRSVAPVGRRTRVGPSGPETVRAPSERTWIAGFFLDAGYVVNSNLPDNHVNRAQFTAPRSGEFTVQYAAAYLRHDPIEAEPWQFECALQFGPAANALVATDPTPGGNASRFTGIDVWEHLVRANVGGRVPKAGTEIAVGLFGTPISMWSFWTKDNWNYSTPWHLNAVPYVLMGGRILQPLGKKVVLHGWVVNGAQTYADVNKAPSYLAGPVITPVPGLQLASLVYFGPEDKDVAPRAWRTLIDNWVFYDAGAWGIAAAFDVMRERVTRLPGQPVALYLAGAINPRVRVGHWRKGAIEWHLTGRAEAFWDRDGRIYGVRQLLGSGALTSDLRLFELVIVRIEYRYDHSNARSGYFYRGAAIHDDDRGLARQQHTVFFTLTGTFEHRFALRRKK